MTARQKPIYRTVYGTFWTGDTGRKLRDAGPDALLVALYLITGPQCNMVGLYTLSLGQLCEDVSLTRARAKKALAAIAVTGFAKWDEQTQEVFVVEMLRFQVGDEPKVTDHKVKGVLNIWRGKAKSPFFMDFYIKYRRAYHLPDPDKPKPLRRGLQGASKGLASQRTVVDTIHSLSGDSESSLSEGTTGKVVSLDTKRSAP